MFEVCFENGNVITTNDLGELRNMYILTRDFEDVFHAFNRKAYKGGLHLTVHSGKLEGYRSISGSIELNDGCQSRSTCGDDELICTKCYAVALTDYRKTLREALKRNHKILTSGIMEADDLPVIWDDQFRLSAFDDLANQYHFINFLGICEKNPRTEIAEWTKVPGIMKMVFDKGYKKPKNLGIIYSSPFIGEVVDIEKIREIFPFIDSIFTVCKDGKLRNGDSIRINCEKHCRGCKINCYDPEKRVEYIFEELKKNSRNVKRRTSKG